MLVKGIKSKGFNNATGTLKKISDYCAYNHLECIDFRSKIEEFRRVEITGKKPFVKEFKPPTDECFSQDGAKTIYQYALDHPDDLLYAIAFLITTGLRVGELCALQVSDIDLKKRTVIVNKMERKSDRKIIPSAKDYSDRIVFLNDDAMTIIKLALQGKSSGYVFINPYSKDGDHVHTENIDQRIRRLQDRDITFDNPVIRSAHDCRRTYASIQYKHGVDLVTIQKQLGHSDPETTWGYIKDIADADERLEKLAKGSVLGDSKPAERN